MTRWKYRFGIPLVGAAVALGAASLTPALANAQTPLLQPMSASQLIAAVLGAAPVQYSGQLQVTSNILGSDASLLSSVGQGIAVPEGTSQVMVYRGAGPDLRLQMVNTQSERDLYVTSTGAWLWSSSNSTADHLIFSPTRSRSFAHTANPTEVADSLVEHLAPTSRVTVGSNTYVAGHAAYTLVLAPRQSGSSIYSVRILGDAKNYHVLSVSVYSVYSSSPVLSMGYQSISFTDPSVANFNFAPPANATVKLVTATQLQTLFDPMGASAPRPAVLGAGWQTVFELPKGVLARLDSALGSKGIVRNLETPVALANGETASLIHTELVNLLVLPNGSTLAGAVRASVLESDANALGL